MTKKRKIVMLSMIVLVSFALTGLAWARHYEPTWESLSQWEIPEWYENAVFGIYWHWGPYSVAGYGYCCWYGCSMYLPGHTDPTGKDCYKHHCDVWGDPFTEFGYKDFIPLFKAEKWDPDRWAELFKNAGADFAGPCAEHHDGFSMWDSEVTRWNAADMGPHRDTVGEIAKAIKSRGMEFVVTFHNNGCNNWRYFDGAREGCPDGEGANNPEYYGLYGEPHDAPGAHHRMCLEFYKKAMEVIDKYQPQLIWLEGCMAKEIIDDYMPNLMAYYFNKAENWGKGVVVTQKNKELPLSCSVLDFEGGGMGKPVPQKWQTDEPLPGCTWAYQRDIDMTDEEINSGANGLVDSIVNRVSHNGATMLSIGPKPDGTIPVYQVKMLKKLGKWMDVNKEALYAAKPAQFVEGGVDVAEAGSVRFTRKGDFLYAIDLEEPSSPEVIPGVKPIKGSEINMLGSDKSLDWHREGDNLVIDELPDQLPCDYTWSFKILVRK